MPPDVSDRLFTKRAFSTKPGGTGLGTKIVKDVVDAHGERSGLKVNLELERRYTSDCLTRQ